MENNGYHLDLFTNSMIQYFNEVLIHKNYVSNSFRKYSIKNGEDIEFSCRIKAVPSASCDEQLHQDSDSAFFIVEDFERLINRSTQWSLHLADVSIKGNRILFKLNQPQTLSRVLNLILNEQIKYGLNFTLHQDVEITVCEDSKEDLTGLRLQLIKRVADNVLGSLQKEAIGRGDLVKYHLATKVCHHSGINVLCGAVVNAETGKKEVTLNPADYYDIQLKDMMLMSEHKCEQRGNDEFLHDLADANVTMSLLEVNPRRALTLRPVSRANNIGGASSKGASFVLYNFARLASIRRRFDDLCNDGVYPKPPDIQELDFSLLNEEDEWFLVFNYLLEYPTMIRKTIEGFYTGTFNTHLICRFLFNLSSDFSIYYRRVRVLLEPRPHLLPVMYARLRLLRAVEYVMENALSLMNIKPIYEM